MSLIEFAEATHPDGAAARVDPEWLLRRDAFLRTASESDEPNYVVSALNLLAWFKDGHTGVYLPALTTDIWALRLPLATGIFADGLFVTSAKDEAVPLLGARIIQIGRMSVEEIIRRFAKIWPAAGLPWAHRWAPLVLRGPGLLHAFGAITGPAGGPILLKAIAQNGASLQVNVVPRLDGAENRTALSRTLSPLELEAAGRNFGPQRDPTENGRNFVWNILAKQVLYVSLDRMGPDDFGKPFDIFEKEVSEGLANVRMSRLIVDLRRNGGGDNMLPEPLRKRIQRSQFNRPGGLMVLIAPHTFSAAQNLATRLERETFAFFVGEPTGSAPNHCGDARRIAADVCALPAAVSTVRWFDSSPADKRTTIMPDCLVPAEFTDFVQGRDVSLETAMAVVDGRPFDESVLTAPWERGSQLVAWQPFWARKSTKQDS
jgi:hypothetical protein